MGLSLLPLLALPAAAEPDAAPQYTPGPLLQRMLDGPMAGLEEIVFATRVPGRDHWYVTFGNYADHSDYPQNLAFKKEDGVYWGYGDGARLCRMNLRTGQLNVIFEDPQGGVRDPQIHYDGQKILFAYRPGGTHVFHLYEINVDGSGLTQLTDGPDDDIEPTYCPDGSIVFCSSRCRRFVNCWYTRVASLYRCDADGGNVRMLSSNNDHDNTPWILPDGRVLYMRWEYVDRSQVHFHHLWTMNPDGTGQMVYYGNLHGGIAMLDAKPIPGTQKVVSSFSPGHGRPEHLGFVTVVDPKNGPDDRGFARNVSKNTNWKDPYALSEDCFLVASPRGLHVMDGQGNQELVYQLPEPDRYMQCHEPRPLRSRPRERVIPDRTILQAKTGRLILEDIYNGRNMAGVKKGEVAKLLVLKQLPKPVNFSGGMQPLTIGGSFTLAGIVGTVPVEPDGSAYMELPALQSLFFVALDKEDRPVKRMHSFLVLQPGETTSCVGCHEQRVNTPRPISTDLVAMRRSPSPVEPIADVPAVIDYPRDVQPILDEHCVQCHCPERREGKTDFTGDHTAMYSVSYWTMQTRSLVSDGRNQPFGNRLPYSYGSAASRLMTFLDGSHYDAKPTELQRKTIRLWIETSATYPGTYAALGCGSYPVHLPVGPMLNRCGSCHVRELSNQAGKRNALFFPSFGHQLEPMNNLSRPEKSYVLLAPLAKEAGGLELCKEVVFADKEDPLYRQMLAALENAHQRLVEGKRFDMPDFRPNEHYLREMQRFGFLPGDLKPSDPVDCYAVDRAYWESFRYDPRRQ
ncbi:MAG: PD40 domain-containing protein [Pirellulales bacterium]|nr:PD40 domain-containing protein [Pirellulales bacterium]